MQRQPVVFSNPAIQILYFSEIFELYFFVCFFVFLILYRRPFCSQRSLLKTRVLLYSHWLIARLDSLNISIYIYMCVCNCCSGHWVALPPARQDEGRTDSDLPPVRGDTSLVDVFILSFLGLSRTATATAAWPRWFSLTGHREMVQHGLYWIRATPNP